MRQIEWEDYGFGTEAFIGTTSVDSIRFRANHRGMWEVTITINNKIIVIDGQASNLESAKAAAEEAFRKMVRELAEYL